MWQESLRKGVVIPACPLALTDDGVWSHRYQRALLRYYRDAGAGGLAVGVHTTQFEIRAEQHQLFRPLLEWTASVMNEEFPGDFIRVAGVCGKTEQAMTEAGLASQLGYHAGLLSLAAFSDAEEQEILHHCQSVAEVIPIFGFYLQPAVGGRILSYEFWRQFCEVKNLVAIKIAAFDRYFTGDVFRAVSDAGRDDIALYTGNDDNIIADLLTPFCFGGNVRYFAGGLLGQWAVWTKTAVELLSQIQQLRLGDTIPGEWLKRNVQLTDANAAIFDAAHQFRGCIPGVHKVLNNVGLLPSVRCLDPAECLSPGQDAEILRVTNQYSHLTDQQFVSANLPRWLDESVAS